MSVQIYNFDWKNIEIEISDNAYAVLDSNWKHSHINEPFSRLYYIKSGKGFLYTENMTITLLPGYVYLIPSGTNFSYSCEYLEKLYFHVSLTTAKKNDLLGIINQILSMPFPESQFNVLNELYFSDNYLDKLQLKTIIYKTVANFINNFECERVPIKNYSETVQRTLSYIHSNIKMNLSVKDISKSLFISEGKIRNSFKVETGITIGKYIDDIVFIEAKKLMHQKQFSINDISEQLGFCDQFYFSRRFKDVYGKTPSEYRKEMIN